MDILKHTKPQSKLSQVGILVGLVGAVYSHHVIFVSS